MLEPLHRKGNTQNLLALSAIGAGIVCTLAFFQHMFLLKVSIAPSNFLLPALVGSTSGLWVGIWRQRIRSTLHVLKTNTTFYLDLLENANDLVQSVSPEGRLLFTNRAWRQTLGYTEKETADLTITDIIHPDHLRDCQETLQMLLNGRMNNGRMETVFKTKDGQGIPVEGNINIHFLDGQPVASRGFFRNIADRKNAENNLATSEKRYRSLVESMDLGITLIDRDYRILMANSALCKLTQQPQDKLVGQYCYVVFSPHKTPCPDCPGSKAMASGKAESSEFLSRLPDGSKKYVRVQAFPTTDEKGSVTGFIEVAEDITKTRQANESLKKAHEFSQTVINSMNDAVSIIDPKSFEIIDVNHVFLEDTGQTKQDVIGKTCYEVTHQSAEPCNDAAHICPIRDTLKTGRHYAVEHIHRSVSGQRQYVEVSTSPILNEQGQVTQVVHVSRDITERRQAEQKIQKLAYYDVLTGLPNRTLLNDRLQQALAHAARHQHKVGILFLDLDRFKGINDTLGHSAGDQLLNAIAKRLRKCIRESDTVARLGGDEFVLVLPDIADESAISHFAQKILDQVGQPVLLDKREITSTVSIGIALFPLDGQDTDALLRNADTAMYDAKESGRNSFRFYSQDMNDKAVKRLNLETSLRRALQQEELFLVYQPQINTKTGATTGVEALLRWNSPELGLVSPGEFISLAEETGLIIPVGEWVLRQACTQIKILQKRINTVLRVAVNLSVRQFNQPDFMQVVDGILKETGLEPNLLEMELTESILMDRPEIAIKVMIALKKRGIHISIDDFGTGFSSLSYLKNLPIDRIKVAQEFVRGIPTNTNDVAIVEAIIAMANSLGLNLIVEGVETHQQFEFFRKRQCHEVQGYYLGKPMDIDALTSFLEQSPNLNLAYSA